MAHLTVPLRPAPSGQFRQRGLIADVWLWVCEDVTRQNDLNAYHKLRFRLDTGATHTSMSRELAQEHQIRVPNPSTEVAVISVSGRHTIRVSEGQIACKFVGLEEAPLVLSCAFHKERPASVPSLLGLNSIHPLVGPSIRYTFDGSEPSMYPYGRLIVEVIRE